MFFFLFVYFWCACQQSTFYFNYHNHFHHFHNIYTTTTTIHNNNNSDSNNNDSKNLLSILCHTKQYFVCLFVLYCVCVMNASHVFLYVLIVTIKKIRFFFQFINATLFTITLLTRRWISFVLITKSLCQSPCKGEVFVLQYITVLPPHTVCDALTKTMTAPGLVCFRLKYGFQLKIIISTR